MWVNRTAVGDAAIPPGCFGGFVAAVCWLYVVVILWLFVLFSFVWFYAFV
jgi:hypothetical protein